MKTIRIYIWVACLLGFNLALGQESQQVMALQFFYNTDPGVGIPGNGEIIPVTPASELNQIFSLVLPGSLGMGFHQLYVRAKDEYGRWSLAERRMFYVAQIASGTKDLTAYQWFVNIDPGIGLVGNGGIVTIPTSSTYDNTISISLPTLGAGFHQLYVRVKDIDGRWSLAERRMFYISDIAAGTRNIIAYQWYVDTDPGLGIAGNGAIVPIPSTATLNTTIPIALSGSLSEGFHQLYIRTKDDSGRWSLAERRAFYITRSADPLANITHYQYYFDSDPGAGVSGNGGVVLMANTPAYNQTVAIIIPGTLTQGIHQLYIRAKDENDRWSLSERRMFYINDVTGGVHDLTDLEYYFDIDPGVGNAIPYPIDTVSNFNQTIALGAPCLSTGTHYVYIRAKDTAGRWSIVDRDTLVITSGIAPSVVTPAGPLTICDGSSVVLSTTPVPGVTYQWVENGVPISGEINPSITVTTSGSYAIRTICGSFVVSNTVLVNVASTNTYFADADGDSYGNSLFSTTACIQPTGYVTNDEDCDDTNAAIHPNATESCNLIDDDCDGLTDENVEITFYADVDDDGFGNPSVSEDACSVPTGFVSNSDDCDDTDPAINPDATEICNEEDDDCDGTIDEGVQSVFYADADNDGFGNPTVSQSACTAPAGYVIDQTDCNDALPYVHTGASELCNGIDDNCDNEIDEGFVTSVGATSITSSLGNNFCSGLSTELNILGGMLGTGAVWKWYEGGCASGPSLGTGNAINVSPTVGLHSYFVRAEGTCNTTVCATVTITVYSAPSNNLCPFSFSSNTDAVLCSSAETYAVSFTSNLVPDLTYMFSGATFSSGTGTGSGSIFNAGETSVQITAENLCGEAQCTFTLTIDDNEGPVFEECPGTIEAEVETGQWGAHVEWLEPQAIDNCDVNTVISSHQPGDFFIVGETAVNYTATDIHGNTSTCSFLVAVDPPEVLGDINISIFANDIQFSDPTPEAGTYITVSATVHNYSNVAAGSFVCRLFNAYSEEYNTDIVVPALGANQSTTLNWLVLTPVDPAFVPMQVLIDDEEILMESNELDNEAQRPYINGEFNFGGRIVVVASAVPGNAAAGSYLSICGNAYYVDLAVPLEDTSVAGAQLTLTVLETGQILQGTTNSNGDFCISYQTPNTAGVYNFIAEVTDFTLSGDTTGNFTLTTPIIQCPKDLALSLQVSGSYLCGQPYHILQGTALTGSIRVYNSCEAISNPTTLFIALPDGTPVPGPFTIPALPSAGIYDVALPAMIFNTPGITFISATVDHTNIVSEANETNNSKSITIHVHAPEADIAPVSGGISTNKECIPGLASFVVRNFGGAPTGNFQATLGVYFGSTLEESQSQLVESIPGLCERIISFPIDGDYAGSYSFVLNCDDLNEVVEGSESNNSRTISSVIEACDRDLIIAGCGQIKVSPADPSYPGTITIDAVVVNRGQLPVNTPFVVDFDVEGSIYSLVVNSTIAANSEHAISITIPAPAHGNNGLTITADALDDIPESQEVNNSASDLLCWDFTLTNISCDGSSLISGVQNICEPIPLRTGLRNSGLYKATTLQTKFEISGPGLPSGWNALGSVNTYIGQTCLCPVEVSLPNPFLFPQSGGYQLRITTDPANQYTECQEGNNEMLLNLQVLESPDYTVYSQFIAPSDLNPDLNESISFNLTYKNEGCTNLSSSELMLIVDNTDIDSVVADGLSSGNFNTYAMTETWSSGLPGLHVARIIIDHDQTISETNELNNEATRAIIVGDVPDFNIVNLQVSDETPQPGQSIAIDATILNEGKSAADARLQVFMVYDMQEILVYESAIHLSSLASTIKSSSWFVAVPVTQVIARVIDADPAEYDYSDNERTLDLNSLTLAVISTDVACASIDQGSLEAQVSGGHSPYFVQWSNGYSGTQIDVPSGTYSVTVTDANGYSVTSNDTIMDLALPFTWYYDGDSDGYGNPDVTDYTCSPPNGYVGTGTDCNDSNVNVYPDASEIPDGLDNDCDGLIDEGLNTLNVEAGDCNLVFLGYEQEECQTLSVSISGGVAPYTYAWSNGANTSTTEVCPEESTIYTVIVTDHNGFTAEDNVTVQVIDITCGNNNNKLLVCHLPPGNPENMQVICIAPSAVQAHLDHGCYIGICEAPDPCEGASQSILIPPPASLSEDSGHNPETPDLMQSKDEAKFLITPNPADDHIEVQTILYSGVISIMNVSGKVVFHQVLSGHTNTINTSSLKDGIYFVRLQNGHDCYVKNLVVIQ